MEYKCPACGNIITKETDGADCHSCGESLNQFWANIEAAAQKKSADENRSRILSEMKECTDNLEKGFQELMTGKLSGVMKVYFEKIASENNPSQFAEYADVEEYKAAYKKLTSKYESYANLLNTKSRAAKNLKLGITAAVVVVVLIGGIAVLSALTRKETNITVQGGESNVAVNVNNNTGNNSTGSTDVQSQQNDNGGTNVNINNDIKVAANASKFQSYVFESSEDSIKYFLNAKDWKEKLKCCNYPDSAEPLLAEVKYKMGENFLKYTKYSKVKTYDDGQIEYKVKGGGDPLSIIVNGPDNGYRIALWSSLYPFMYGGDLDTFYVDKSESKEYEYIIYAELNTDAWDYNHNELSKDYDYRYKYNTKNAYQLLGWGQDGKVYRNVPSKIYVLKDSKAGKKIYDILKDGHTHRVDLKLVWDNDNYTEKLVDGEIKKADGFGDKSVIILKDVVPCFDVGYIQYKEELTKLEENFVPAPKQ